MSLIYRAIWAGEGDDTVGEAFDVFAQWAAEKSGGRIVVPQTGEVSVGDQAVTVARAGTEGRKALLATHLHEIDSSSWTLSLTAVTSDEEDAKWTWVDLHHTAEDPFGRPPMVAAPQVVVRLLQLGDRHLGTTRLSPDLNIVGRAQLRGLAAEITSPGRVVPMIVFTRNRHLDKDGNLEAARQSALHLAGVATVSFLDPVAERALEAMLPEGLSVYGGAVRVYLPDVRVDDPQPWRHRWFGADRWKRGQDISSILAREIAPRMALRRPPPVWSAELAAVSSIDRDHMVRLLHRRDESVERLELQFERAELRRLSVVRRLARDVERTLVRKIAEVGLPLPPLGARPLPTMKDVLEWACCLEFVDIAGTELREPDAASPVDDRLGIASMVAILLALEGFARDRSDDLAAWVRDNDPCGIDPELIVFRRDETGRGSGSIRSLAEDPSIVIRFDSDHEGDPRVTVSFVGVGASTVDGPG